MTWNGQVRWEHAPGRGYTGIGYTMVPNRVTMTGTGQGDTPDLAAQFEMRQGRPECTALHVTAKRDGRGIRTSDLAEFNMDALAHSAVGAFAQRQRGPVDAGQRSRRGGTTETLQRVADIYREHADTAPTKAVQIMLGYSARTAARRVQQARAAGLLPPAAPGKVQA